MAVKKKEETAIKDSSKKEALMDLLSTLQEDAKKTYGISNVGFLGKMKDKQVTFLPTGSLVLDTLLGGGVAKGRIIEFFGPESSGKTSMAVLVLGKEQERGGSVAFLDIEHAASPSFMEVLGVNIDELLFLQPSSAKDTFQSLLKIVRSGTISMVVVDSVSAMTEGVADEDLVKDSVGKLARNMSKNMPVLAEACSNNDCTVIFINQTREKIGVMFGDPTTTSGGNALKFYATQRVKVNKKSPIKDSEGSIIGTEVGLKIEKNKAAMPGGIGSTLLSYSSGIDTVGEVYLLGVQFGVIGKNGNTFFAKVNLTKEQQAKIKNCQYDESTHQLKLAVGEGRTRTKLAEDSEVFNIVSQEVMRILEEKQEEFKAKDKSVVQLKEDK